MKPWKRLRCRIGWHPRRWYVRGQFGPAVRGCRDCTWQQWSVYQPSMARFVWLSGFRPDFEHMEEHEDF